MAEQEQDKKSLSDAEIENLIKSFRERLDNLNYQYRELLKNKIVGDFYIGPNLSYTNLPDKVIFKRHTTETF